MRIALLIGLLAAAPAAAENVTFCGMGPEDALEAVGGWFDDSASWQMDWGAAWATIAGNTVLMAEKMKDDPEVVWFTATDAGGLLTSAEQEGESIPFYWEADADAGMDVPANVPATDSLDFKTEFGCDPSNVPHLWGEMTEDGLTMEFFLWVARSDMVLGQMHMDTPDGIMDARFVLSR